MPLDELVQTTLAPVGEVVDGAERRQLQTAPV
jgi:hypothetical protein